MDYGEKVVIEHKLRGITSPIDAYDEAGERPPGTYNYRADMYIVSQKILNNLST